MSASAIEVLNSVSPHMVLGTVFFMTAVYYLVHLPSKRFVPLLKIELTDLELSEELVPDGCEIVPEMPLFNVPKQLQMYDPATGAHLGFVEDMDEAEVYRRCSLAKKAQRSWSLTSMETRKKFLRLLLKYTIEESDEICRVAMRDSGKALLDAKLGEITPTVEKLRWMLQEGENTIKPSKRTNWSGLLTAHKSGWVEWMPVGVIASFSPFNYPFTNVTNHIISGVFAGNGVVCKVSEYTSFSASFYSKIVKAAIVECGGDPDLVQMITGGAEAGKALSVCPDVDKIIFTGSDKVGKLVASAAAMQLTPCVLELGGKDPFVVFEDVDLNVIVPIASRGVLQNAGQNCIGIERIFVSSKIHDEFVNRITKVVEAMRQEHPFGDKKTDIGTVCMPHQLKLVEELVNDAISKGAKVHVGGKINKRLSPGLFFEPTVLSNVTSDMRITQEEVFGPVAVIRSFGNENDLVRMVNDCPYGLGSSVFSKDNARCLRIARQIHAGMNCANDFGVNYLVQALPFGGVKASGYGRFGGPEGLKACCYPKAFVKDAFPGISTQLPKAFTYPVSDNAPEIATQLLRMGYALTPFEQLMGLGRFLMELAKAR